MFEYSKYRDSGVDEGQRRCHGTSAGVIKVNVAWGPLL